MSLTSILSDKAICDKLRENFDIPNFYVKCEIKAPPLTKNYSLIGTAFDYLLRFYVDYHNKHSGENSRSWVSDTAVKILMDDLTRPRLMGRGQTKFFRTEPTASNDKRELVKLISNLYAQSKANYLAYYSNGLLTEDLIANTVFLAKLDSYYRSSGNGKIDFFEPVNSADIEDLRKLLSLVDNENFIAREKCYLNPTFGKGSYLVDGADADIVIDNTLIEIKVTKNLKLERKHFDQIIGYYILSLIGGLNGNQTDKPIENIGIYFARHGHLWTIPTAILGSSRKFTMFKNWFTDYVERNYPLDY